VGLFAHPKVALACNAQPRTKWRNNVDDPFIEATPHENAGKVMPGERGIMDTKKRFSRAKIRDRSICVQPSEVDLDKRFVLTEARWLLRTFL
jgi:hypothetical protein